MIQDEQVLGLGDVYLYESTACGAAWAQLNVGSAADAITVGATQQLSEIVYEAPGGGIESGLSTYWDQKSSDIAYSPMVPETDSVKACGGNADVNSNVFDIDPQGNQGLYFPGVHSATGTTEQIAFGACTLWH